MSRAIKEVIPTAQLGFSGDLAVRPRLSDLYPDILPVFMQIQKTELWQKHQSGNILVLQVDDYGNFSSLQIADQASLNVLEQFDRAGGDFPMMRGRSRHSINLNSPRRADTADYYPDDDRRPHIKVKTTSAFVFVNSQDVDVSGFSANLGLVASVLQSESPVFVIETGISERINQKSRQAMLKQAGFTKVNIIFVDEAAIWAGRLPLERHGMDLWEKWSVDVKKKAMLEGMIALGNDVLLRNDLQVINRTLAIEHLHQVKNPLWSLKQIRSGHGARVRAPCGCIGDIGISGVGKKDPRFDCQSGGCQMSNEFGINYEPPHCPGSDTEQAAKLLMRVGESIPVGPCFDCGGQIMDTTIHLGTRKGIMYFETQRRCGCWDADETTASRSSLDTKHFW